VKLRSLGAAILCCCLAGCLGYHVGPVKPYYLREVHSISVPMFTNRTLLPRVEAIVTDTVIKQFQQDGTYQIASDGNGDATLKAEISNISRSPARSVRGNVLATTEFVLTMQVKYSVLARDGTALVRAGTAIGRTSFFVSADIVTDERQALPLATEDLARQLITQLSEGW
jgi:hypothetical protein